MSKMTTFTGRKFDPIKIKEEDICIEDIAHALSLMCRGNGQINYFYTVGQHSINCAKEAKARGWSKRLQLICLLHDASEAYIADIIRPVKPHLINYLEIEKNVMDCIHRALQISPLTSDEDLKWKEIDDAILIYELKYLMHGEENRQLPLLSSVPDLEEKNWKNIQTEFLRLATELV